MYDQKRIIPIAKPWLGQPEIRERSGLSRRVGYLRAPR